MSRERVELVRSGYEAWNSGDRSWVLEHMAEDVEWVSPPEELDPGAHRGREGVEGFWAEWRSAVGQLCFQPEQILDRGDHIVSVARRSGTGVQSGVEISDRVVQVFSFKGDKCVRVREFYDLDAALRSIDAGQLAEP